jgi:N-acyl homoserine lactone hydrolase
MDDLYSNIAFIQMRELHRKTLQTLFAVLVIVIVAPVLTIVFGIYGRRSLPALSPLARTTPNLSNLPLVQVCWIETGHAFGSGAFSMTASALLVRHPKGDVLIDAGNSSHFNAEVSQFPFWERLIMIAIPGRLRPRTPLPDALRAVDESLQQLRLLIPSHIHLDHIGGYEDLPKIPVLLDTEEMNFSHDRSAQKTGAVIRQQAAMLQDGRVRGLQFSDEPYEVFTKSFDLYGDGSIVVVPLPGHTPGSVGVFLNLDPDHRVFYLGDAALQASEIRKRIKKPFFIQDVDPVRAADQVQKLNELLTMNPHLEMIAAHGRSDFFLAFPKGPGTCIQSVRETK